jgi:2-amino-4-hydroxy-6-hydroxymethyldihydropteridine diphosphokinase
MNAAAGHRAAITVFVGLGSNLADPVRQLQQALRELAALDGTELVSASSFYETAPVGMLDQPMFINAVAMLRSTQPPHDLLRELLAIEARHARLRREKNGPRTLDLDLLLYGEMQIDAASLTVPHPRMHERAFVLVPLLEIAPALNIPGKGSVRACLEKTGSAGVRRASTVDDGSQKKSAEGRQ